MKIAYVLFSVFSVIFFTDGRKLPSYVKKCKRHDPELNECMREAFTNVQSHAENGIKSLRIAPINPYTIPFAQVSMSWMNASLTNLQFHNIKDVKITSFKIDLENNPGVSLSLIDPHEELKTHYVVEGNFLQVPLSGEGEGEATIRDIEYNFNMKGKIIEKNGKEYLKLENPVLKVEKFLVHRVYLHNLFQDNPEMTERVNQLLTENIMTYEEEIIPILERFFIGIFENPFRETFDYFSLDELFD